MALEQKKSQIPYIFEIEPGLYVTFYGGREHYSLLPSNVQPSGGVNMSALRRGLPMPTTQQCHGIETPRSSIQKFFKQ